jgi:hypothetical protein
MLHRLEMPALIRSVILVAFTLTWATVNAANIWQPERTFVLVASVIEWPAKAGLTPFNEEKRRDEDLVNQFKRSGVPPANIIFLKDSAATHAAICNTLTSLATRAGTGSTMIFYFQGHGGRKLFCCYDTDSKNPDQTELHAEEIYSILSKSWKGDRLLVLGDCCNSGSLASIVWTFGKDRPDVRAACFASATASNISTSHWTFTASLIRVLAGDPQVDRDRDGKITVAEAGQFIHDQMKYQENQLAAMTLTSSFEKDFVIRATAPGKKLPPRIPGPLQIGDVLEARDSEGNWYTSEIIGSKPGASTYKVHFYGWDSKWDEWVGISRLRRIVKPKLNVGQQYEVQWEDKNWYLGTITRSVEGWFYYVHYESESGDDDEWVTPERTRPAGKTTAKERPRFVAAAPRPLAIGNRIAAQWFHDWYRAKITGSVNGTYTVVYDDQTKGRLASDDLIPLAQPNEIRPGDRVLACWDGKPRMFPGKIESIKDQLVTVRWEDGTPPTQVPLDAVARIKP